MNESQLLLQQLGDDNDFLQVSNCINRLRQSCTALNF